MNNIITINNLKKYFKSGDSILKVLDDLNLSIRKGDIVAITGESGVGKSTLLSLMGGLDNITSGEIFIKGKEISKLQEKESTSFRAENLGFVFQNHYLLSEFTAYENILLPTLIKRQERENVIEKYINELLDLVHLKDRRHHKPGTLSGGECQRIALLRALVNRPEIVMADEPTGNLDEKNTVIIFDLIKRLNKKYKVTFIIATHNFLIKKYCDELYVIKQGKIFKRT